MTLSIISNNGSGDSDRSPFDAIRGYKADGTEYWTARELMKWLGYPRWQKGEVAIERAIKSLKNQGYTTTDHVTQVGKDSRSNGLGVQEIIDYELSRLMCYMVAMNADPEKEMVALAQGYFAKQTYKQELAEPQLPVQPVVRQLAPQRDAIDYIQATATLAQLPNSRLKRLLDARLVAELSIDIVNQKQIAPLAEVKNYTTATVRSAMLGYSATQIGTGSGLGKFIKAEIAPDFSDWQGQFYVAHYEVCAALDSRIHAYFVTRSL